MKPIISRAPALALLLALGACGQAPQTSSQSGVANQAEDTGETPSHSMISRQIQKGMEKAKQELATRNIDVNSIHIGGERHDDKGTQPKAEITPQGDLLIAGSKVPATPAQQVLLLDYRKQIVGIAEAGMDIGSQGADLGVNAAKEALWGALAGKSDKEIEATIRPQTDKIQAAALKLCKRLPDLLSSQQKLAAAMPRFQPYATMEQKDVDDCGKDITDKDGKKGLSVFSD